MANYLTFASAEPFTIAVSNATKNWDGVLEYSTDTVAWDEWDGTTAISSAEHGGEHRIYMRGSGNSIITGAINSYPSRWVITGSDIRCTGNIENLLDYGTVANDEHPVMGDNCFTSLFHNCKNLVTAPALSATTLAYRCYTNMFYGCSNLTEAPTLPATTMVDYCYNSMFAYCTSLVTAPALPATILADRCYGQMFSHCSSLAQLPELPATGELPTYCYLNMFEYCSSIKLSETQSDEYTTEYRIPTMGTATLGIVNYATDGAFNNTGGAFTGTPEINTTYYTANKVIPATQPVAPKLDPTALLMCWQVGNRIRGGA